MNTQKHSVGPWKVIYGTDEFTKEKFVDSVRTMDFEHNHMMGDYQGCIVADFNAAHGGRTHAYNEAEANAQLIAAAPEMLEALQALSGYYKKDEDVNLLNKCILAYPDERAWKLMREAIKKATK